jgi:hypothetical protein
VARERAKAVRWLRRTLDSQDIRTRVLDRPLLRSQIGRLDRSPKR